MKLESGFEPGVAEALQKRGYKVEVTTQVEGGTEMRRDGQVAAY